jgi:organic radical activating enzyme
METKIYRMTRHDQQPHHQGLLWVYLNGRCNFACSYCLDGRNKMNGRPALNAQFIEKLHELQSAVGYTLIFTGGEPLIEIELLQRLYKKFTGIPKSIQTNGSLVRNAAQILPYFEPHDWLSISVHDETYANEDRQEAVRSTISLAAQSGVNVFLQLMCSPSNIEFMLTRAEAYTQAGHRVVLRRLFEHEPDRFTTFRGDIERCSTERWAAPAFFGDEWSVQQPFKAMTVYLNGDIAAVCKKEISLGNLYSQYDLGRIASEQGKKCEEVCHCCSCLWATQGWGFA